MTKVHVSVWYTMKTESVDHFTHYIKCINGMSIGMRLHDIVMLYQESSNVPSLKKKLNRNRNPLMCKKSIMGYLKNNWKWFYYQTCFLLKVMKDERQLDIYFCNLQFLHQYLWWYHLLHWWKVGCFILLTAFIFMSMNISDL